MFHFLRHHWFDLGGILGVLILLLLFLYHSYLSPLQILLSISLVTLFFHQVEEYRFPGYFPGMINTRLFKSKEPDRYPLNMQTALIINVCVGWGTYIIAILFAGFALWIAIASILVSLGNVFAHVFLFNIKGKTIYNPGMITSLFLFLPITIYFFYFIEHFRLGGPTDYIIGIPLGILLNYFGVIKLIKLLKDKDSKYIFPKRFVR